MSQGENVSWQPFFRNQSVLSSASLQADARPLGDTLRRLLFE